MLLTHLACAGWPCAASAGVFNEPAGHGLVIVEGLFDTGRFASDARGRRVKVPAYTRFEGSAYLQYGVTNWLMALVQPDVVATRVGGTAGGRYSGFGTSAAGAQVQLPSLGPLVFALQGTFRLPGAAQPRNPALVGNTSRDAEGRGLVGTVVTLGPYPGFVDAQAGYRLRGGTQPDEVHVDVTGGLRLRPDVLVMVQSFSAVPTQAGTPLSPRSTYSKLEGSAVYDVDARWSVQAGVFGTVWGRNALRERGLTTAVWYRF